MDRIHNLPIPSYSKLAASPEFLEQCAMDPHLTLPRGHGVFSKENHEHEIIYLMCNVSQVLEKPLGIIGGLSASMNLSKLQALAGPETPMFSEWCDLMRTQLELEGVIDKAIPVPMVDSSWIGETDTRLTKVKSVAYPREDYGVYHQEIYHHAISNHFSYYDKLKLDLSDTEAKLKSTEPGFQSLFEKLFNKPETTTGVVKSLRVVKK